MQILICMYYAGSVESQGLSIAWRRLPVQVAALCTERETSSRRDDPSGQAWEALVLLLAQKGDSILTDIAEVFPAWLESWSAAHGGCCAVLQSARDTSEDLSEDNINPFFSLPTFDRTRCLGFISPLQGRGSAPNSSFPLFSIFFLSWLGLPFGICRCWQKNQLYRSVEFHLKLIFVFVGSADFCFCDAFRIFLFSLWLHQINGEMGRVRVYSPIDFVLLQDIFTLNANSGSYNTIWIMKSFQLFSCSRASSHFLGYCLWRFSWMESHRFSLGGTF